MRDSQSVRWKELLHKLRSFEDSDGNKRHVWVKHGVFLVPRRLADLYAEAERKYETLTGERAYGTVILDSIPTRLGDGLYLSAYNPRPKQDAPARTVDDDDAPPF